VLEECGLNLGGGETVTRNVDNIVNTATDPVVTIVITSSTISGELILVRLIFSNTKQ
jgi:hypothetical protein